MAKFLMVFLFYKQSELEDFNYTACSASMKRWEKQNSRQLLTQGSREVSGYQLTCRMAAAAPLYVFPLSKSAIFLH